MTMAEEYIVHLLKSNKWDAAKDVLFVSKRLELLSEYETTPRNYKKRNAEYWETKIKEKRVCQRAAITELSSPVNPDSTNECDVANMTPEDIKAKLAEMGIRTRLRNVKILQEQLENALESASQTH